MTLPAAIRMAAQNGPRVRTAQSDLKKAEAGLSIAKDVFIPSVVTTAGVGDTYGVTLTVPTIFTIGAQSLVFSDQQRFYLRAAHSDVLAAGLALTEARDEIEEDAAITYLNLAETQIAVGALAEQASYAAKFEAIVLDRTNAGLDSAMELKKAQRGAIQIRLAKMEMEDRASALRGHLAELTGIPRDEIRIVPESIPEFPSNVSQETPAYPDNAGILAAEAKAEAQIQRAEGDARYTWKPTITFGAQYGRVSPINNVSEFYNLHGNYNTANAGIQINFPVLDMVRKNAANQSLADATRAQIDAGNLRTQLTDDRNKLQRSIPELSLRAHLAELDFGIAHDELQSSLIQAHAKQGTAPVSPKEVETAHIHEQQKYLDYLEMKMQFAKAEIWLLRQTGHLTDWIGSDPEHSSGANSSDRLMFRP